MENTTYTSDLANVTANDLTGFFVGWTHTPSAEKLLQLLQNSRYRLLATDKESGSVMGYITALSDDVLFGHISSLEVLPDYQKLGIGKRLVDGMMSQLDHLYAIDLVCDPDVQPFYERCGFKPWSSMIVRRPGR